MKRVLRENGLSLTLGALFLLLWLCGQALTGYHEWNKEREEYGAAPLTLGSYLRSAHFVEATSENWESEFLQMAVFVAITVFLFQKGSAESKNPWQREEVDRDPEKTQPPADAPWPVRRGGWVLAIYEHSLTIAFVLLFLFCLTIHAWSGCANENAERALKHEAAITVNDYVSDSRFWFESFQNWQSEFLAIFSMVVLSVFLRQRGSPESKPVDAPHGETGK